MRFQLLGKRLRKTVRRLAAAATNDAEGAAASIGIGLVIVLGTVLLLSGRTSGVDERGCPPEVPTTISVLVDATDQLPEHRAIGQWLRSRFASAPAGARIRIAPLNGVGPAAFRPVFDRCLPGESRTTNSRVAERERERVIESAWAAVEDVLRQAGSLSESRILESAIRAARETPAGEVLVVTDGLENSSLYRSYGSNSGKELPEEPLVDELRPVSLRIVVVVRNGPLMARQERAIREFWSPAVSSLPTASIERL